MSDEARTATEAKEEGKETAAPERGQLGASPVGLLGIALIIAYLILLSILLLYSLVQFWPPSIPAKPTPIPAGPTPVPAEPTPVPAEPTTILAEEPVPPTSLVTFLFWQFAISDEGRLFLIVALAGALGSLVHAFRSLYWYVGHRALVRSWLVMYILVPFVGTTLGLVFYLVIRGGFFSPQATVQQTSPFGFAALASLVGMFSEQAVLKLKQVAETLLIEAPKGADAKPQERG